MARFASMVDLARTPEEVKEEITEQQASVKGLPKPAVPTYPYGLCLYLDDDTLEKIGIDGDLPDVGDQIHFTAMARVTSASQNEKTEADGDKEICRRIELQITSIGLMSDEDDYRESRRRRFYGDDEGGAGANGED